MREQIITVHANSEVSLYQERHGAIIHRRQVMQWLDGTVSEFDLLVTPPARTFLVEEIGKGRGKGAWLRQRGKAGASRALILEAT